jgi:hypothetical protein
MAQVGFNRTNEYATGTEHLANRSSLNWITSGGPGTMALGRQQIACLDVAFIAVTSTKAVSDGSRPQSA